MKAILIVIATAYLTAFACWFLHQGNVIDSYFYQERNANIQASGKSDELYRAYDCNFIKFHNARQRAFDKWLSPNPVEWIRNWNEDYIYTECP